MVKKNEPIKFKQRNRKFSFESTCVCWGAQINSFVSLNINLCIIVQILNIGSGRLILNYFILFFIT